MNDFRQVLHDFLAGYLCFFFAKYFHVWEYVLEELFAVHKQVHHECFLGLSMKKVGFCKYK